MTKVKKICNTFANSGLYALIIDIPTGKDGEGWGERGEYSRTYIKSGETVTVCRGSPCPPLRDLWNSYADLILRIVSIYCC